ncbi:hypothetical protein J2W42_003949 [Rhizobium tibeticum]|nr:hypothetical protein [Rhizobium tibeticum]
MCHDALPSEQERHPSAHRGAFGDRCQSFGGKSGRRLGRHQHAVDCPTSLISSVRIDPQVAEAPVQPLRSSNEVLHPLVGNDLRTSSNEVDGSNFVVDEMLEFAPNLPSLLLIRLNGSRLEQPVCLSIGVVARILGIAILISNELRFLK